MHRQPECVSYFFTGPNQVASASHAPIAFIDAEALRLGASYVVCSDQSHKREKGLSAPDQRATKRAGLKDRGWFSFYYVSHAPFVFASRLSETLQRIQELLLDSGIPATRFEADGPKKSGSHGLQPTAARVMMGAAADADR